MSFVRDRRGPVWRGFSKSRLRWVMLLFFVALAAPALVLVREAYSQLKWEAFHRHRVLAEELSARIDQRLGEIVDVEEARSFGDYSFLVVEGEASVNFVQRSPLSEYPVKAETPGLIGYFQIDAGDVFSTPLLPYRDSPTSVSTYGISSQQFNLRRELQSRIWRILNLNRLVSASPSHSRPPAGGSAVLAAPSASDAEPAPAPNIAPSVAADTVGEDRDDEVRADEEEIARDKITAVDGGESRRRSLRLRKTPPASEPRAPAQAAFDRLNSVASQPLPRGLKRDIQRGLGRVEDLKLDDGYAGQPVDKAGQQTSAGETGVAPFSRGGETLKKRGARKEQSLLAESYAPPRKIAPPGEAADSGAVDAGHRTVRVAIFESEIAPFEFSMLNSGHFVLYRKVWRDGQRYIQGMLFEQQAFIRGVVGEAFHSTALSQLTRLAVAYVGNLLAGFGAVERGYSISRAEELQGALLFKTGLPMPFSGLELIFTIDRLPVGPGGDIIVWVAGILALVLCGGFFLMYRLGLRQIELAAQQRDFVSAVSHELKTPLTSIRMYGEILREGWADERKKRDYYDYIYSESERLSRLIENVLQLARMTRNDLRVALKPVCVDELLDNIRSKIASQVERAGFELRVDREREAGSAMLEVDADLFAQIAINLVDNAIKFSAKCGCDKIDFNARLLGATEVAFTVRDYGPGVPKAQMKRIFRLFFRSENELTRETTGTGIGLALVRQLCRAMGGRVDVVNRDPGAEFRVIFPADRRRLERKPDP